jgi:hypothetical protein
MRLQTDAPANRDRWHRIGDLVERSVDGCVLCLAIASIVAVISLSLLR